MSFTFANEGRFKTWFGHCIEAANGVCFALAAVGCFQLAGVPDRYISHPMWHGFLEMKKDRGITSKAQEKMLDRLMRTGTNALILRYTKEQIIYLETWDHRVLKTIDMREFIRCGIVTEGHWGWCFLAILSTAYELDDKTDEALRVVIERMIAAQKDGESAV